MTPKHSSVAKAYAVLGLKQDSTLETVNATYRQLALHTHPDKNPKNADATAQFQRLSEAYNVVLKHLDGSSGPPPCGPHFAFPFGSFEEGYNDVDDADDEFDPEVNMTFYKFLFAQVLNDNARAYSARRGTGPDIYFFASLGPRRPTPETTKQYQARVRHKREEQAAAEELRKRESVARKERIERQREEERREAEERQRAKVSSKKAEAEASKQRAQMMAWMQRERMQSLRTGVFAAARAGDAGEVKKGVWEDEVDATGGEVMSDCDGFVYQQPVDKLETLLHIAARQGDADLVEWLDGHSADVEERDSNGYTAFHIALQHGHIPVLNLFISAYPPKDADSAPIYSTPPPPGKSLLFLALDSRDPEVVWVILDKELSTPQDIAGAWAWVSSAEGKQTLLASGKDDVEERYDDIKSLLMTFGEFTSPPSPEQDRCAVAWEATAREESDREQRKKKAQKTRQNNALSQSQQQQHQQRRVNVNQRGRGRGVP